MAGISQWLRLPRPKTFLYFLSLQTGVELIAFSVIFNKLTGFYGLLAIFTGVSLSPIQLSMYIYSVFALVLLAYIFPHIRKQSPFECLAFAWIYIIDMLVNAAFTAAFAVTWFLALSAQANGPSSVPSSPGSSTIDRTAGFTSPNVITNKVDVVVNAGAQEAAEQGGIAAGIVSTAGGLFSPSFGVGIGMEESLPSMAVIIVLTVMRLYVAFVVMAYARQVLQQHLQFATPGYLHLHTDGSIDALSEDAFALGSSPEQAWRSKVGKRMLYFGRSYWLDAEGGDDWSTATNSRVRKGKL